MKNTFCVFHTPLMVSATAAKGGGGKGFLCFVKPAVRGFCRRAVLGKTGAEGVEKRVFLSVCDP